MFNHLDNKYWNENQIQFFSACLIQSFIGLRKEQLIHRDIHFGNLVLDEKQYINLIDFHIAIEYKNKDDPKKNLVGTPLLCAPEMIKGLKYDYNSDYYRLGGMIYFILFRKFPNIIKNKKNVTDIIINYNENKNYSISCIDFINKLIITDYKKRIGFNNIDELENHDFFKNFNWSELIDGKMKSPFPRIPRKSPGFCKTLYNFKKKIFIKTELLINNTFRNIFFSYDNINNAIIDKIFQTFKNNINK
jgi:serine/threonine protein kinase